MSEFRILCDEIAFEKLEETLCGYFPADTTLCVELIFTDEEEIKKLNREQRSIDKVTDVLSFPTLDHIKGQALSAEDYPLDVGEDGLLIGSIAICIKRAEEQAEEYGHSYERELNYLLVHAILHCMGYDHMTDEDKAEMREKEEEILTKMGMER